MAKVQIKADGTIEQCIQELAFILLQHAKLRDVVVGAAIKVLAIEALENEANMNNSVAQMKEFMKGGE